MLIGKKKALRVLAAIAACSVLLLGACGKSADGKAAGSTGSGGSGKVLKELKLPLVDKPTTLKLMVSLDSKAGTVMKNLNEMLAFQELEKRTGIHIEFIHPPAGQEKEFLNLAIASGDLPDMIFWQWRTIPGGPEKAINDGLIMDLTSVIRENAPNYKRIIAENKDVGLDSMTDSGKMYMIPGMRIGLSQRLFDGFMLRKDWLDKLGIKPPQTMDEWYSTLVAIRDKDPNGNGKADEIPFLGSNKINNRIGLTFFTNAWGMSFGYYVDNGKIKFGPGEQAYKEYLATMRKWYSEKLIDPDYMISSDRKNFDAKVLSDRAGSFYGQLNGYMGRYLGLTKNKNFALTVVPFPTVPGGGSYNFSESAPFAAKADGIAVSAKSKYAAEAVKWCDYILSPEGSRVVSFGVEGVTYTMVGGVPKYTDLIMKNPDGLSFDQALSKYTSAGIVPRLYQDPNYWSQAMQYPAQLEGMKILETGDLSRCLPALTPGPDEASKLARMQTEIETYRDEMFNKFIMGQTPLSDFDKYISTLESLGLKEALEMQQKAYERYLKRGQ